MSAPTPLTHHELLALATPLVRQGCSVDLAASDRLARRIAFRARERDGAERGLGVLHETLHLDCLPTGTLQLHRTLRHASGLEATVEASGSDAAALLARVERPASGELLCAGEGFVLARHLVADGVNETLARGEIRLDGLRLEMRVSPVRGVAAEIRLVETGEASLALPEDLLAVLGWDWTRLVRERQGWHTRLRLRGGPTRRTRTANAALDAAAIHLARTLAEPPWRFHERHLRARLFAVFRRSIPLLTPIALVITVLAMPRLNVEANPTWLLLYHVPTALIALAFLLQELPTFALPPWPRARREPSWQVSRAAR